MSLEDDKPKYDPRFPPGFGTWRKQLPDEQLKAWKEATRTEQVASTTGDPLNKENSTPSKDEVEAEADTGITFGTRGLVSVSPDLSFLTEGTDGAELQNPESGTKIRKRRRGSAIPGIPFTSISKRVQREQKDDSGSEQTKPLVVGLGEEFHPYALFQGSYRGAQNLEEVLFLWKIRAATATLQAGVFPNLDFQIVTIPPNKEGDESDIIIESDVEQALDLHLIHITGQTSGVRPIVIFYGFNKRFLPLVQRLRFSFIDAEGEYEAKPEEEALQSHGKIQFRLTANENELTADLRARFDLAEDPLGRPQLPRFPNAL